MYSPNIIQMIKPRTMKWMSDVVRVEEEERKGAYSVLMGKPKG